MPSTIMHIFLHRWWLAAAFVVGSSCGHEAPAASASEEPTAGEEVPAGEEPAMSIADAEVHGTLVGKTDQRRTSCNPTVHGEGGSPEAVYPFTLSERSDFEAELTAAFAGAVLALEGPDGEITCGSGGAPLTIRRTLGRGEYVLIVESRGASGTAPDLGSFVLRHHAAPLPSRESACAAALPLAAGEHVAEILEGPSQLELAAGAEHIYTLTTEWEQRVRLRAPRGFSITILRGCDENTVVRQSRDDDGASAVLSFVLGPGSYYVVVEGAGAYTLSLETTVAGPSEVCAGAEVLELDGYDIPHQFSVDTLGADGNTHLSCGAGWGSADASRRLRVDRLTELHLRATSIGHDGMFSVRTTCGNNATPGQELFCSRAGTDQRLLLSPGIDYFVTAEGAALGEVGETRFHADLHDLTDALRACSRAPRIRPGSEHVVEAVPALADLISVNTSDAVVALRVTRGERLRFRLRASEDAVVGLEVRRDCVDPSSIMVRGRGTASDLEQDFERGTYFVHVWMATRHPSSTDVSLRVEIVEPPLPPEAMNVLQRLEHPVDDREEE